jgi:hypothetical protein
VPHEAAISMIDTKISTPVLKSDKRMEKLL